MIIKRTTLRRFNECKYNNHELDLMIIELIIESRYIVFSMHRVK